MNEQSYKVKIDFSQGSWIGRDNNTDQPATYIPGMPDRIIGDDSFEIVAETYEDDATTKLDMSSATANIYIASDTDGASRTDIGNGTVSGTGDYITTFVVAASAIPSALYGGSAIIILEWTSTGKQRSAYQRVEVTHYSKGTQAAPTAALMGYTPGVSGDWLGTAPDDVAEALDDLSARLGEESAVIADTTINYSSNDPSIVPDGAVTIADGSSPSVAELLELCEELLAKQNTIIDALQAANLVATP